MLYQYKRRVKCYIGFILPVEITFNYLYSLFSYFYFWENEIYLVEPIYLIQPDLPLSRKYINIQCVGNGGLWLDRLSNAWNELYVAKD